MNGIDYEGNGILNLSLVSEYRGNSYAIGGDTGAITLANFVKKYNPDVKGASVLSHIVSYCGGNNCKAPLSLCKYYNIVRYSEFILIAYYRSSFER